MPCVSVVIPCYNQGAFIDETINSVLAQTCQDFEIIVVNDGSTDPFTVNHLQQLNFPKTRVLHTENQGLSSARNNGIREAQGEYILPLDADDRIGPTYLEQAVQLLDADPELGIVYCKARFFGDRNGEWQLPEYSLEEMLLNNVIFCTSFFRRADWEEVGGFDPAMIYGWEDYDFWLSLIERGRQVQRIPEILFYYRIRSDSMLRSKEKKQKVAILTKIFHKHEALYKKHIDALFDRLVDIKGAYLEAALYRREHATEQATTGQYKQRELLSTRRVDIETKALFFDQLHWEAKDLLEVQLVNEQAIINIKTVKAETEQGRKNLSFENNATFVEDSLYFFTSKDPRLMIRLEAPTCVDKVNKVISLTIELDYLIIGDTVPEHLVSKLNEELTTTRPTLAALEEYIERRERTRSFSIKNIMKKLLLFYTSRSYRVVLRSGLFDRKFYLREYPDVFFQEIDPLIHYCTVGWKENRKPYASFDPEQYKEIYGIPPDTNPLLHFLESRQRL
ncbi:Glycosyl transferase family 2 [Candidatus Electrothrix aarhusensis]|uniref:Glycosyl transferase family 2 n=1 Tax=Candidatus Electrothrix aarhusensis TaxID=1859131 RepID=A0A3S3U7B1_9BACT|nr:Glycosyl transferase family 2 [Candidatus Electrothrix aarhusensis]